MASEKRSFSGEEKDTRKDSPDYHADAAVEPSYFSSWFGGPRVRVGPRIAPVLDSISLDNSSGDESSSVILAKQLEVEAGHAIKYRTCSWQKVNPS